MLVLLCGTKDIGTSYNLMRRGSKSLSSWMMKMVFLDSCTPIGPSGADSCVATVINCFPGFYDSSFNTELLKILLISQS